MLKNLIILPDGTEVFSGNARDNAIISCEFSQFVNDGAELSIGSACCNELEVKLFAKNLLINANDEIKYYKVSGNGNRTKIGVFRCEKPTVTGTGTYKFVAYDRVSWLDKDLTDWLSSLNGWPYSVENFAKMVCEACGLTLAEKAIDYSFQIVGENLILTYSGDQPQYSIGNDGRLMLAYTGDVPDVSINENGHLVDESGGTPIELPNGSYQIRKFSGSGVTGRMLMQWLGQITCRFIRANADGEIEFAWYSDKGKEITTRGEFAYFGGGLSYEDFTVAEIQKVQIKASENDNGTVYPDGSEEELNTYKITGNYLLTAETGDELKPVARAIFEQLQGVTYTPCKVSIQATTEINAGDIVHITDRNGVTITTYVMSKTNKGQKDTLECTGSYKRDSSTATNTLTMKALNGKVLDIKKNVDGLRIENKDTAGNVSKLEIAVDGLKTSVEDAECNISKIEQTAGEVHVSASNNTPTITDYSFKIDQDGNLVVEYTGDEPSYYIDENGNLVLQYVGDEPDIRMDSDGVVKTTEPTLYTVSGIGTLTTVINGSGEWNSKFTRGDEIVSALYFDFSAGHFVFDGHVVARSGDIGGCSIIGGKLMVPSAHIAGPLTIGQLPENVATTDLIPTAQEITTITENTVATTTVIAKNLHVQAANIDGILSAKQIKTDDLTSGGVRSVGEDATVEIENGITTITHIYGGKTFKGDLNAAWFRSYNPYALKWFFVGNGNSSNRAMVGWETGTSIFYCDDHASFNGNWDLASATITADTKATLSGTFRLGSGNSYHTDFTPSTTSYYYGSTLVGVVSLYSNYIDIIGTWKTNGSAWIQSSDARLKNTIEDFTDKHDILFDNLHPRSYKWNDGTSDRTHSGFIVQEVVEAVEKAGLTTKDFAAVVNFKDENGEDDGWGLRYEEIISLNTWQIQKLKARIAKLEERLKYAVN